MSALTALLRLELHPHLALLQRSQHKFSRHINQEKETAMRSLFFGDNGHRSRAISRVLSLDSHSSRPAVAGRLKQPTRMLGEQRHGILFGLAADGV